MNTNFRKLFCLILSVIFVFSFAVPGFASTIEHQHSSPIDPEYIGCPEGGKHLMRGIGWTECYVGDSKAGPADFWGYGTQCINCYLVLVTEYPANVSTCTMWGTYVVKDKVEPMFSNPFLTNVVFCYSSSINGHFEQGFEFIIVA